jgi:hypothetical protein
MDVATSNPNIRRLLTSWLCEYDQPGARAGRDVYRKSKGKNRLRPILAKKMCSTKETYSRCWESKPKFPCRNLDVCSELCPRSGFGLGGVHLVEENDFAVRFGWRENEGIILTSMPLSARQPMSSTKQLRQYGLCYFGRQELNPDLPQKLFRSRYNVFAMGMHHAPHLRFRFIRVCTGLGTGIKKVTVNGRELNAAKPEINYCFPRLRLPTTRRVRATDREKGAYKKKSA